MSQRLITERARRFCSNCGEQIKARRAGFLPFGPLCTACAPGYRRARVALFVVCALFVGIVFAIGRLTSPRDPFYFIGTPLDISSARPNATNQNAPPAQAETPAPSRESLSDGSATIDRICGAPTKSGRPCQRKVKGGGYCWQHRDKFGPKKTAGGQ